MARLGLCTLPFSLPDSFLFSSRLSVSSSPSLFFLMSMMLKKPVQCRIRDIGIP